ncbi:MAG: glycosyltransferase family 2 protein [Gammaproteobacteria bacterium]|nr:glycosyltransferase family 2 protein [Gammaproteobacteria bacterium]MCW5582709.1 glycosyltransferase family 2 protein [Gammaproteobacteria bacterium]
MIDISVLIVNYNTAELVKKCVESVSKQRDVNFEVIVIDNNSCDDSIPILQKFTPHITLILNHDNQGFGRANNQAFKLCQGRYIFMLNPDAVCLTDYDLYHVVKFMDEHLQYGLVGTRIVNGDHHVEQTTFLHYPRQKQVSIDFSTLPGELATVLGASMVVRREVFEETSGFDEEFFLYGEETDLCLRIRKAGYMIGYCQTVTVQHVGSASEKGNPREEVLRKKKAGKLLFYRKHYPHTDVIKIVKQDLRHAQFHLLRLSFIKLFFGLNQKQEGKYKQHVVARDLAKSFLSFASKA